MPYDAFDIAVMHELHSYCQPWSLWLRLEGQDSLDEGAELGMCVHEVPIVDAAEEVQIEGHECNEARPCIVIIDLLHRLVDINGLEFPRELGVSIGEGWLNHEPLLELGGIFGAEKARDGREELVGSAHPG